MSNIWLFLFPLAAALCVALAVVWPMRDDDDPYEAPHGDAPNLPPGISDLHGDGL